MIDDWATHKTNDNIFIHLSEEQIIMSVEEQSHNSQVAENVGVVSASFLKYSFQQ